MVCVYEIASVGRAGTSLPRLFFLCVCCVILKALLRVRCSIRGASRADFECSAKLSIARRVDHAVSLRTGVYLSEALSTQGQRETPLPPASSSAQSRIRLSRNVRERDTTGEPRVLASAGNPAGTHGPFLLIRGHLIGGGGRTAMKAQAAHSCEIQEASCREK